MLCIRFVLVVEMATVRGLSRAKLKPSVFRRFIVYFVKSLSKDDRAAFRYLCIEIIPRAKLDINIDEDGDIFNLIEFLENDDKLSFTDMSFLKEFLLAVGRIDLLEVLKKVEIQIAIGIILEEYQKLNTASLHQGSGNAVYADVVEFLVSTREKKQELVSQALEQLRQAGEDYSVDGVIQEYQLKPEFISWSEVTALLVIIAECSEAGDFIKATIDFLADWMLELGGLVSFVNICSSN